MKTILAVDDNPVNLVMVREYLQDEYKVSVVTNGKQALSFLEKKEVDLVLLDVLMPQVDGIETLRAIKANPSITCPIVMLTALNDNDIVSECISLGALDYIEKPFSKEEIREKIGKLI